MRICVIGAGIMGLTIAYELSCRGHAVTIVEKDGPFAGASHRSFAWINANNKQPASYHRLNSLAVQEHRRFQDDFPSNTRWLSMSGNLLVDFSENRPHTYSERMQDAKHYGSTVYALEGESSALLEEIRAVMEDELVRLFRTQVAIDRVFFSGRSFPEDGRSIVGHVDDAQRVYAAVTHSGMTLAPLIARLTAEELDGKASPLLKDFRPSRFMHGIERVREPNVIGRQ